MPADNDTTPPPQLFSSLVTKLTHQYQTASLGQAKKILVGSILKDVENLLNTRPRCLSWPKHLTELDNSLLNYGLPDFASRDLASPTDRGRLAREIEAVVKRHEPRLTEVRVQLLDSEDSRDNTVHYQLQARVGRLPEFVTFHVNANVLDAYVRYELSE